jgi:hypothetical protein
VRIHQKREGTVKNLLDHLQEQGYMPDDDPDHYGDCYDLVVSGIGSVRACIYPTDGGATEVYAFDRYVTENWHARFSPNAPGSAIIAALEAAEWQLADKRGGPVTPAQEAS